MMLLASRVGQVNPKVPATATGGMGGEGGEGGVVGRSGVGMGVGCVVGGWEGVCVREEQGGERKEERRKARK